MKIRVAISRLLTVLAVAGLVLAPIVRPTMALTAAVDVHASSVSGSMAVGSVVADAMDKMPCCPDKPSQPDCSKQCPLMALCVTAPLHFASQIGLTVAVAAETIVFPVAQSDLASVADAPPRKPPKI